MKLKSLIAAASIALLPVAASAATFIVPAAGTGPGANDSHWQSELTLHSTSASPITAGLTFHDQNGAQAGDSVTVPPRGTVSLADIVQSRFGRQSATGAIEVTVPDPLAGKLAITSRTSNGAFGQDVPAINAADAATAGSVIVLQGPSSATGSRFNFGIYAVTDTTVQWQLVRADGTLLTPIAEQSYAAGTQVQFNNGISTLLGASEQDNDTVQAAITGGAALAYGSAVNNDSGDPSYVPGIPARADIRVDFAGVDLNEDGVIDVADADHDGVLDHPIDVYTSLYPNFFRVIVNGGATLELVDAPRDAMLVDARTVEWAPGGNLKGQTGTLKIKATVNGVTDILTIPVNFR